MHGSKKKDNPRRPRGPSLTAALEYAKLGWHVYPVRPENKVPYTTHGFYDASTDPKVIKAWWASYPDAMINVRTGEASNLLVVDLDRHNEAEDGVVAWAELVRHNGGCPPTRTDKTPRGGRHLYFKHRAGIRNVATGKIAPGVEVKAEGGNITAPPSRNASGKVYEWESEGDVADPPEWLIEIINKLKRRERYAGEGVEPQEPVSVELVRTALGVVDPDINRHEWIAIGCALFKTFGDDDGFKLWDEWSEKGGTYVASEMKSQWDSIALYGGYNYTIGTVFYHANEADPGWRYRANDEPEEQQQQAKPGFAEFNWHGDQTKQRHHKWLVKGLLKEASVGLVSGQWGTAKTYLALELAGCVMIQGQRFVDYRVKRNGGVLFIAAEGADSIPLRLEAMIADKLGRSLLVGDNPRQPFVWWDHQPDILGKGSSGLIKAAEQAASELRERFGVDLALIVVDTLIAAAGFKDEDDAADVQRVMNALWALAKATGAAKEGSADSILSLIGEREVTGKISDLKLGVRKVKDAEFGRVIPFRLNVIDCGTDEDGDKVTTCVIRWELDRRQGEPGRPPKGLNDFKLALSAAIAKHEMIEVEGERIKAARLDLVRQEFKALLSGLSPKAINGRWHTALAAALSSGEVEEGAVAGIEYVWWRPVHIF